MRRDTSSHCVDHSMRRTGVPGFHKERESEKEKREGNEKEIGKRNRERGRENRDVKKEGESMTSSHKYGASSDRFREQANKHSQFTTLSTTPKVQIHSLDTQSADLHTKRRFCDMAAPTLGVWFVYSPAGVGPQWPRRKQHLGHQHHRPAGLTNLGSRSTTIPHNTLFSAYMDLDL